MIITVEDLRKAGMQYITIELFEQRFGEDTSEYIKTLIGPDFGILQSVELLKLLNHDKTVSFVNMLVEQITQNEACAPQGDHYLNYHRLIGVNLTTPEDLIQRRMATIVNAAEQSWCAATWTVVWACAAQCSSHMKHVEEPFMRFEDKTPVDYALMCAESAVRAGVHPDIIYSALNSYFQD